MLTGLIEDLTYFSFLVSSPGVYIRVLWYFNKWDKTLAFSKYKLFLCALTSTSGAKMAINLLAHIFLFFFSMNASFAQNAGGPWNSNDYWCQFQSGAVACGAYDRPKCNLLNPVPFDGKCFSLQPLESFLFVHEFKQFTTGWNRTTPYLDCGDQHCHRTLKLTRTKTVTETSANGTQITNSHSHVTSSKESFEHGVKLGLKAHLGPFVEVGPEYSFTYTNAHETTDNKSYSKVVTRTYSYAVGKSLTRSDEVTCDGIPHQRMYVGMRTHPSILKGNSCTYSGNHKYTKIFECKYVEIKSFAMLEEDILDADFKCFSENDPSRK